MLGYGVCKLPHMIKRILKLCEVELYYLSSRATYQVFPPDVACTSY